MTITANQVKSAFYVSGANAALAYEQFITTGYQDIEMVVSSSSNNFFIRLYPTASNVLTFTNEAGRVVDAGRPIILPPISESITDNTTKIFARINTTDFDKFTQELVEYPIQFNLTGWEYVLVNPTTTNTTTLRTPRGETVTTTTTTSTTTNRGIYGDCFQNGSTCITDFECCSGYCYNPNPISNQFGIVNSGVCAEYNPNAPGTGQGPGNEDVNRINN